MPKTNHEHRMQVVSWSIRPKPDIEDQFPPAVLIACTTGVCAKTEVLKPGKRDRKVPEGVTPEQFKALKAGYYWPEILLTQTIASFA